ncbi:MAG: DUF3848 domain-containing protein [Lachnospiraceae bacterium]|nr:DUF3848 domain-containing protein [Lachnospiraceae bacterium]
MTVNNGNVLNENIEIFIRNDLTAKIADEYQKVYDAATEDDLTSFHSEVYIKYQFRDAFYDLPINIETVRELLKKDNALEEAYQFYLADNKDGQVYLVLYDYLDRVECDYLAGLVHEKVKAEYSEFINEVIKLPPKEIVEEAYKIATLTEINIIFEPEISEFNKEQLTALLSIDDPLWGVYREWQSLDITFMDEIMNVIREMADFQMAENEAENYDITSSFDEQDDGLEP